MSNRRKFIKQTGVMLAATALPLHMCTEIQKTKSKFKMGLQLFSIRDAMAIDPIGTLKKVRALGYEDSELFGYDGAKGTYYGMKAKDFKTVLDDLDFTVTSGHYDFSSLFMNPFEELKAYLEQCIDGP